MKELLLSLLAGRIVSVLFSWFKLPLPVPPLAGLLGLAGMSLGGGRLSDCVSFLLADLVFSIAGVQKVRDRIQARKQFGIASLKFEALHLGV